MHWKNDIIFFATIDLPYTHRLTKFIRSGFYRAIANIYSRMNLVPNSYIMIFFDVWRIVTFFLVK